MQGFLKGKSFGGEEDAANGANGASGAAKVEEVAGQGGGEK